MTWTPSLAPRSARASPIRRFNSSDSTTQGPAIRKGAASKCRVMLVAEARQLGGGGAGLHRRLARRVRQPVGAGGADESREQRVGPRRPRLELGVELAADEPWMIRQLDDLHERAVGREAGAAHPVLR